MRSMLLALTLLLPTIASATDVRGTLSTHTVWTRSGSPYLLKGDVTVAWGTRLTLEPGVQVIAASEDTLDSGMDPKRVELIIDGTLVVRGTRAHPVEFTTQGDTGSWYGIRVRGGRGTVIDGALITRAHQGLSLGMSAVVKNTSVSATSADCLQVSWGRATLEGNRLNGCGLHLSEWARVSLREDPGASTFRPPAFAEARVRGRSVFSFRDSRVPEAVTHVASRPAHHQELLAIGGGGSAGLPRPERLVDPRPLGSRPSARVSGLPAHPALAAIPLRILLPLAERPARQGRRRPEGERGRLRPAGRAAGEPRGPARLGGSPLHRAGGRGGGAQRRCGRSRVDPPGRGVRRPAGTVRAGPPLEDTRRGGPRAARRPGLAAGGAPHPYGQPPLLAGPLPGGRREAGGGARARGEGARRRQLGADHPTMAWTLRQIGRAKLRRKRAREALPDFQRAAEIQLALEEDVRSEWTATLSDLGLGYLKAGMPREALAPLEKAVAGWEHARPRPVDPGNARFLLGWALWESGGDRSRALRLIAEARQRALALGPAGGQLQKEVEVWLGRNGSPRLPEVPPPNP